MRDDDSDASIRQLVDRWIEGWTLSRGLERERLGRGWRVEVAAASRRREYIIAEPTAQEVRELAALVEGRADHWLSVVGEPDARITAILGSLERVTVDETMMMAAIARSSGTPSSAPVAHVAIEQRGAVAHARVVRVGETAAIGQVASTGTDAVFDRIETFPRFQRQGLGSAIMVALTAWAAEQGAQTGLLMASNQGHGLYRSLGWHDVSPLATFRGAAA